MNWLVEFMKERPALFARYVCYIILAVAGIVAFLRKNYRKKHIEKIESIIEKIPTENKLSTADNKPEDKNRHSKIIKALCKEILLPLGVFQQGNSRTFLDDNGWFFTTVEFQPSAWSRGTYLNIGVSFLWLYKDYLTFDVFDNISGRYGKFIEYKNDEQFEREVREYVLLAKKMVLFYRVPENVKKAIYKMHGGKEKENKAMYCALNGNTDEAKALYQSFMSEEWFSKNAENYRLPTSLTDLTYDFVMTNIKDTRAFWRSKPSMKKMRWYDEYDGYENPM